jgi:hypothetical protein
VKYGHAITNDSDAEQKRFLIFAGRSIVKVVACICQETSYIEEKTYIEVYTEFENLVKKR